MSAMPLDFIVFKSFCDKHGYEAVDQRLDKIPSNIYAMRTRNKVKVEIKKSKSITSYVAGQGLNSEKLELLKTELESCGMLIIKANAKHLLIELQDNILQGFLTLVKYIEDIDGIVQRQAYARLGVQFKPNETYIFIAETLQNAITRGQPWAISRGYGGFDALDNEVTIGYSIKGRQQELNGKNAYREHMVPCDLMMREAIKMFNAGSTVTEVALLFQTNNKILKISDDEANTLDNILRLRTTMPPGWEFGNDVYARIHHAGILLENNG